jgi:hypothetical protein
MFKKIKVPTVLSNAIAQAATITDAPALMTISPTKTRGNITSKNKSIVYGGIHGSGEVSLKDSNTQSFRR